MKSFERIYLLALRGILTLGLTLAVVVSGHSRSEKDRPDSSVSIEISAPGNVLIRARYVGTKRDIKQFSKQLRSEFEKQYPKGDEIQLYAIIDGKSVERAHAKLSNPDISSLSKALKTISEPLAAKFHVVIDRPLDDALGGGFPVSWGFVYLACFGNQSVCRETEVCEGNVCMGGRGVGCSSTALDVFGRPFEYCAGLLHCQIVAGPGNGICVGSDGVGDGINCLQGTVLCNSGDICESGRCRPLVNPDCRPNPDTCRALGQVCGSDGRCVDSCATQPTMCTLRGLTCNLRTGLCE